MAWLFGWYIKLWFFYDYLRFEIFEFPVRSEQFPDFFLSNEISLAAYYLPALTLFPLFIEKRRVCIAISCVLLACATILGLHVNTYNDMTFVSSFWIAAWLLWFACSLNAHDHLARHAPMLAKCIIALLFLGGTVGKVTPEYWSGEAFYNLVVRETPAYFGNFLTAHFSADEQLAILAVVSKIIVLSEAALVLSPVYPYPLFCALSILTIVMLVLFRGFQILSVLSCLAGVSLACLLIPPRRSNTSRRT